MDWGARRIGLAASDPAQRVAHPLGTLTRRTGRRFPLKQLTRFLDQVHPTGVVLGLPLSPDGSENASTEAVRRAGTLIADKTGLPVTYWDERFTTARALSAVRDLAGRTRGREGEVDPLAAVVLLQSFLDARRP